MPQLQPTDPLHDPATSLGLALVAAAVFGLVAAGPIEARLGWGLLGGIWASLMRYGGLAAGAVGLAFLISGLERGA